MSGNKQCKLCSRVKTLEHFSVRNDSKVPNSDSAFSSYCKPCHSKYVLERRTPDHIYVRGPYKTKTKQEVVE